MKIIYLSIIAIAFSVLILNWEQVVEGRITPMTVLQLYKESDIILVGNVTSAEITPSGIYTFYHVKIEQYLKGPQQNDTIAVVGSGPSGGHPPPDPKFMVGDRVRLYLEKQDGMYMISMYSTKANPKCYGHELLGLGPIESAPRGGNAQNFSQINCGPPFQFTSYPHTTFLPPSIQFKSGVQASSIACNEGYQLIIKNENDSPACVGTDTVQTLIMRGWGKLLENIQSSSALKLYLSTNSTVVNQGHTMLVKIWLNNTSSSTLVVNSQDKWPLKGLSLHPCDWGLPFGVGLFEGNYSLENITMSKQLSIYQHGVYNCPAMQYSTVNTYVFQPLSSNALLVTPDGNFTSGMTYGIYLDGFYVDNVLEQLKAGTYTIVGGDEWGDVVIRHFTVTNSSDY